MRHPSGINQEIVDKVVGRRGRLHAFETLNPKHAALIVVDLDEGSAERARDHYDLQALAVAINSLAGTLRSHGGVIAWVTTPIQKASENYKALYGDALSRAYEAEAREGVSSHIWQDLQVKPEDIIATKLGSSAFFPGKNDLHEQLQDRQITSLFIAGLVTNVCCEASARDAAELDYQVTLVSDAMLGHKHGQHEATLATFFRNYGDVRPVDNVIELITGAGA